MKINIGISARHVHLSNEDLITLFGKDYKLKKLKNLNQPNEFASCETVSIKTPKNEIKNIRVLGPTRNYTQVEISKTDSYILGINPPVRNSGDLEEAALIEIIGPKGVVEKKCCIIASRHIHIDKKSMAEYELMPNQTVKVKVDGIKGGIMENVYIRYSDCAIFEMHIDLDDGNSHLLNNNDIGYIVKD